MVCITKLLRQITISDEINFETPPMKICGNNKFSSLKATRVQRKFQQYNYLNKKRFFYYY